MTSEFHERLGSIEAKLDTLLRLTRPPSSNTAADTNMTLGGDHKHDALFIDDESDEESPPSPQTQSASSLARMSREALKDGNVDRALELASKALAQNPDSVSALRARGRAFFKQEAWDSVRTDLSQAQQIDFDEETDVLLKEACAKVTRVPKPPSATPSATPEVPSGLDLETMMKNPAVMGSVADVLRNPEAMRAIQDSPLFQSMLSNGAL
jgi:tetratricopeptide (TPR) repeat protein